MTKLYGQLDASYQAAGGIEGITQLVNDFYDFMETLQEAKVIRAMHSDDLTQSRQKLAYFLSGWLGGPRLYRDKYGPISIPMAHRHLNVEALERDAWILCMQKAVEKQPYEESFKVYLIEQLKVPAERIRMACEARTPS